MPRIYDPADLWHNTTHQWVHGFINRHRQIIPVTPATSILNAGSGGEDCTFPEENVYHVDLTERHLPESDRSFVADIHDLPFEDGHFDVSVCVGSVLNYCDMAVALASLVRVTKDKGHLFIEFETSWSWDYIFRRGFMNTTALVTTFYHDRKVRLWVYSETYIRGILDVLGVKIISVSRTHTLSSLVYRMTKNAKLAAKFCRFEPAICRIPFLNRFCTNVIFFCSKK